MIKKGKQWREGRHVFQKVSLEIPDRDESDVDDITDNQIRYLKSLAPEFDPPGGIESLGKWQASAIIDAVKNAKEDLEAGASEIPAGRNKSKASRGNGGWIGLGLILIAVLISKSCD